MSVITFDFPLDELSHLKLREGQKVMGSIHGGKLQLTITVDDSAESGSNAAQTFVHKWSGKGRLLSTPVLESDPRLAALTAKHLK